MLLSPAVVRRRSDPHRPAHPRPALRLGLGGLRGLRRDSPAGADAREAAAGGRRPRLRRGADRRGGQAAYLRPLQR
jgi:hypothetical protein